MWNQGFQEILDRFVGNVGRRFHMRAVVLFGSYGRGEPAVWSDVDIAVVSPDFEGMSRFERMWDLSELWSGARAAEIFGFTEAEIMRFDNPLVWEIVEEGRVLLDDGIMAGARGRLDELKRDGLLRRVGGGWRFDLEEIRKRCKQRHRESRRKGAGDSGTTVPHEAEMKGKQE